MSFRNFVFIFLLLISCSNFAIKENITGNYYIIAGDIGETAFLSYHEKTDGNIWGEIIGPTVFGAGYNNEYIIVEQHPMVFPNPPAKGITNYFILPINNSGMDWKSKNGLIGPLTLEEFKNKKRDLNIPETLVFTKVIEYLK